MAAVRPALTRSLTMRVMSSAVRMGEGVEESILVEALQEAYVAVAEGADNDGSLGGWLYVATPHRPAGSALAPKPISLGMREAVSGGTGMVTTGGTVQTLEPPGGRELWVWPWAIKSGWAIRS